MKHTWKPLGAVAPDAFSDTRVALHHAVRIVSAVGKDLVPPEEDASHKSLTYDASLGVLAGWYVPAPENVRAGIRVATFELVLLDQDGGTVASLPLVGRTLAGATAWLNERLKEHWPEGEAFSLQEYRDFPPHPVADGAPFPDLPRAHLEELEHYYANTRLLLLAEQAELTPGPPLRIWPHHFDEALLINLGLGSDGEARSIGIGFSPGDAENAEPYLYVTPWPHPPPERLPQPEGPGHWQVEPWFGARLDASELVATGDGQHEAAAGFVRASVEAARRLLGA